MFIMRPALSLLLFLALAVARGEWDEFSENSALDSENGKQLDSINLRGIGSWLSKLFGGGPSKPSGSGPNGGGGPSGPSGSGPNGGGGPSGPSGSGPNGGGGPSGPSGSGPNGGGGPSGPSGSGPNGGGGPSGPSGSGPNGGGGPSGPSGSGPNGGGGPSGPSGSGPNGGGGPSGPSGSGPNGGGGPSGPSGSGPNGGGPAGPPFINVTDFENQLDRLSKIMEQLGGAGMGPMPGIPGGAPMLPTAPWMSTMVADLEPCPTYKIPDFLSRMDTPTDLNDTIDFPAVRPVIQQAIREALDSGVPPTELLQMIAPKLFKLKSGCPVSAIQRLIAAAFARWADEGMEHIVTDLSEHARVQDVYPLTNAIKEEVMAEINRTIFGKEFEEFEEVLKFVQAAVTLAIKAKNVGEMVPPDNTTRDPAGIVFPILQYVLQCDTRPAFLQELISRIAVLKRRVLMVGPWPFTVRVLKRMPFPCGGPDSPGPEVLRKILEGTTYALRIIKRELGRMMLMVERAIIFGDAQGLREEIPKFLGNQTGLLETILQRIKGADLPPTGIPPPPLIPDFPEDMNSLNETVMPLYNGTNTLSQNYTNPPTPPPQNGTNQSPPTTTLQPPQNGTTIQNGTTPTPPQRRSQTANHNYKAKLLALLKRLVAKKRRDLGQ